MKFAEYTSSLEALPYSYLAGWIAMLLVETPLMLRIYRKK